MNFSKIDNKFFYFIIFLCLLLIIYSVYSKNLKNKNYESWEDKKEDKKNEEQTNGNVLKRTKKEILKDLEGARADVDSWEKQISIQKNKIKEIMNAYGREHMRNRK